VLHDKLIRGVYEAFDPALPVLEIYSPRSKHCDCEDESGRSLTHPATP